MKKKERKKKTDSVLTSPQISRHVFPSLQKQISEKKSRLKDVAVGMNFRYKIEDKMDQL